MAGELVVADWQFRLKVEREELEDRMYKLNTFMRGTVYQNLCKEEQYKLQNQKSAMNAYAQALTDRIANFYKQGE